MSMNSSSSPADAQVSQMVSQMQAHIQQLGAQIQHLQAQQQTTAAVNAATAAAAVSRVSKAVSPTKPDTFKGNPRDNADGWWWEMQTYMSICGIEDPDRVPFASAFFRDSASSWLRAETAKPAVRVVVDCHGNAVQVDTNTWEGFHVIFLARFRPLDAAKTARSNLFRLQQTGSVQDYSTRFLRELQLIDNMNVEDQLQFYVHGLKPHIALEVEKANATELSDAMNLAARMDRLTYRSRGPQSNNSTARGPWLQPTSAAASRSVPMELGNIESSTDMEEGHGQLHAFYGQRRGGRGTGRRQRVPGVSKEVFDRCMQNGLCLKCQKPGHLARNCTSPINSQSMSPMVTTTISTESTTGQSGNVRAQ
jgi:hypothetical protein